jgi:hypothetical protein
MRRCPKTALAGSISRTGHKVRKQQTGGFDALAKSYSARAGMCCGAAAENRRVQIVNIEQQATVSEK